MTYELLKNSIIKVLEETAIFLTTMDKRCANNRCLNVATKICTGCRNTRYCSVLCQKQHRNEHRAYCLSKINKLDENLVTLFNIIVEINNIKLFSHFDLH